MSKLIGRKLPERLRRRIQLEDRAADLVVPLISVDDAGLPHPALISVHELILQGDELVFFMSQRSRSCANLKKRRVLSMLFVEPAGCFYLKGYARFAGSREGQAIFRFEAAAVLEDFPSADEGTASIVSSTRFQADPASIEHRAYVREEILGFLSGEP